MQVSNQNAAGSSVYQGKIYYFCTPECKRKFDQKSALNLNLLLFPAFLQALTPRRSLR
jgi:YHS domain-containing protein